MVQFMFLMTALVSAIIILDVFVITPIMNRWC